MHILTSAGPLVSLIAGILILVVPRLLNYIVAIYLIVIGLLGLFGATSTDPVPPMQKDDTANRGARLKLSTRISGGAGDRLVVVRQSYFGPRQQKEMKEQS